MGKPTPPKERHGLPKGFVSKYAQKSLRNEREERDAERAKRTAASKGNASVVAVERAAESLPLAVKRFTDTVFKRATDENPLAIERGWKHSFELALSTALIQPNIVAAFQQPSGFEKKFPELVLANLLEACRNAPPINVRGHMINSCQFMFANHDTTQLSALRVAALKPFLESCATAIGPQFQAGTSTGWAGSAHVAGRSEAAPRR